MFRFNRITGALFALASLICVTTPAMAKPYKAAEIVSSQTYKYGRYEMRMQVAKGSGVLSTFFTYKNGSEQAGTFWEEIDIEIFGKNNATQWQSNVIIGTNPNLSRTEGVHTMPYSLGDGYHTYVLEWTPNYIAWFVDGAEVRRITGGQFVTSLTNPQDLRFNLWAANIAEWVGPWSDAILPVYQFVNYIEYKPWVAATNSFGTGWRDDFNSFDTARWSKANWTFGDNLADFDPNNVTVKNGTLVLALTKEGQNGYSGTPPVDSGSTPAPSVFIEAETFNEVGGGVTVANGVVGYIDAGEWFKYNNVNIPQAGTYRVEYKVASALTTAQFTLDKNGVGLGTINVPNTGDWGTYWVIYHDIYLPAGAQNLAIYANSGGFNIDWLKLTKIN
ncbi:family 16 glycosylhydrolase [Cellvibrio sp. NN19]|uniref:family 16 glycosylhydrolase n=1 Tax=Cellvibrio chitinivorans TaxID=3102792 RepID=UPI002B41289B|nr:family 16 glycosylhydrolase [Cellvibrio sp. NN19]